MSNNVIELTGISKRFGRRMAVSPLDLAVPRGSIYGLLGHNGAGKSTALGIVLGQVFPDAGSVRVHGADVFEDRVAALSKVGAIFESYAFYDYLSGATNLRIFCEYTAPSDPKRIAEVVALVGLEKRINDRVGAYSHGMKQRLALAQALLPGPELLILDEPTDGLDPQGIVEMRQLILRLNREMGMTVLLSSHLLHEAEELCTHIAVMHQSKLLFAGPWSAAQQQGWMLIQVESDKQAQAMRELQSGGLVRAVLPDGRVELAGATSAAQITRWLVEHEYAVSQVTPIRQTLEDFYLRTIGLPAMELHAGQQGTEPARPVAVIP